jgi:hypothetical protein
MAHSNAESVFILQHYFTWKPSVSVPETFGSEYHDEEVTKKTAILKSAINLHDANWVATATYTT